MIDSWATETLFVEHTAPVLLAQFGWNEKDAAQAAADSGSPLSRATHAHDQAFTIDARVNGVILKISSGGMAPALICWRNNAFSDDALTVGLIMSP